MMIRKGNLDDLQEIMTIISDAKELLRKSGSRQWNLSDGYPNEKTIETDIINS